MNLFPVLCRKSRLGERLRRGILKTGLFSICNTFVMGLCLSACVENEWGIPVGKDATADKPQSKVWNQHGTWWCILFDGQDSYFYWMEGGEWRKGAFADALISSGSPTRADVLSDGANLYVLVWGEQETRLFKYRYANLDRSYSLVRGFPVSLDLRTGNETAVITVDSQERLWITYESEGIVYVSSSRNGLSWDENSVVGCGVDDDDISSIIAFEDRIGVFWSNQRGESLHFRVRNDDHSAGDWGSIEVVAEGGLVADDHINLAEHEGWVYAVTKTSVDDAEGEVDGPTQAQIILSVRSDDGAWSLYDVAPLSSENVTRPIIVLDDENREAYLFYREGSEIVYKVSALDDIDFSNGTEVALSVPGVTLNNVTSTKQNVDSSTGVLILATGENGRAYHRLLPIH